MTSIAQTSDATLDPPFLGFPQEGPVIRARKLRTHRIYALCVIVGLLPAALGASAGWQVAGLGLLFPGAGFFSVGGWALRLVPVFLALYGLSLIAWFGAGMISAPILIWLGSAAPAAGLAGGNSWKAGLPLALAALVLYQVVGALRKRKSNTAKLARREERKVFLSDAVRAVETRAIPAPPADQRELSLYWLKAFSHGEDLELVLYAGKADGAQQLTIERLQPGRGYPVQNAGKKASASWLTDTALRNST
ncbi:hypothetical protein BK648_24605 [Pseudomonas poae]|uniref:Uncharacterized protein n=1 Tax=Pseudomonas poae TaxID=200451 RepID=A0A423ERP6_9PSED|nr:hypothetical protein [Pseudomonas poae]ROM33943.1 hypothetical protein BK648_24605 [Pseudomonas poae]